MSFSLRLAVILRLGWRMWNYHQLKLPPAQLTWTLVLADFL
jgi:hypothetical protein